VPLFLKRQCDRTLGEDCTPPNFAAVTEVQHDGSYDAIDCVGAPQAIGACEAGCDEGVCGDGGDSGCASSDADCFPGGAHA
jgi:hypothetical protein